MCANIIKKHDDKVYVYDVIPDKTQAMAALGAIPCESALEVARDSDIFITMVPKSENSTEVYTEILPEADGLICIDMSTIHPHVSVQISEMIRKAGGSFADAPVVKSRPAALEGKLGIYVGCDEKLYEKILPVLSYMGENIIRMGENGKGLVMKICHNALVSQIQNGVNETATLASLCGIDILTYAKAVSYGGAGNWYLDSKKQTIAKEDFTTAFSVANEHKDVHICLELAEKMGFEMPGEENAARVYDRAMESGIGAEDFSATIKVVRNGSTEKTECSERRGDHRRP